MSVQNIKRVAVIGAGISGVSSAAHLLKYGLDVVLFERSNIEGGVWHFDPRSAVDPSYPNEKPSAGDYETVPESVYGTPPPEADAENGSDLEIAHAPPGPCYAGLMNNVSTRLMRTSLAAWPPGTEDFVSQQVLEEYIQAISKAHGVSAITQYNTRVEEVRKRGASWDVRTTTLEKTAAGSRLIERRWKFDAVVVASGHYHAPRVPDIPGLKELKEARPDRVWHSKRYRDPTQFKDKTVLLIGAGVSSSDIAKEGSRYAKHIFQSSRGGVLDLPASLLPEGATRIRGIESFNLDPAPTGADTDTSKTDGVLPASVTLNDGRRLCGIDFVILCTGYMISYPFLRYLHSDTTPADLADDTVLVTADGDMAHNLHKDMFYIPDPTLVFVGAPYHIATFSFFDFQAQAVARVLAGKARLPSGEAMRDEYRRRVAEKGRGRDFHSLRGSGDEEAYVQELVRWMNEGAAQSGLEPMLGHTDEWHEANLDRLEKIAWIRATTGKERQEGKYDGQEVLPFALC